jgi:hypothetical protein
LRHYLNKRLMAISVAYRGWQPKPQEAVERLQPAEDVMRATFALPLFVFLAACGGQSNEEALENAAEQSDPVAAEVLNDAAENGMNVQDALKQAGEAAAQSRATGPESGTLQARPNLPQSPNRKDGTEPPDKIAVNGQ